MKKSTYYLFGSVPCQIYIESDDIEEVSTICKTESCCVFQFVDGVTSPSELLYVYNGFEDYTEITETEFLYLQKCGVSFAK
jgi:hypothetical protein